jgi:predicted Zn-dependent protease
MMTAAVPDLPPCSDPVQQSPCAPIVSATQEPSPRPVGKLKRVDLLGAESALLTEARAELRRGDASAAQVTLDRLRSQFPKGVLVQERDVLAIEVSIARGNREAAKRMARAFVESYPKSPHSTKLRSFLEEP